MKQLNLNVTPDFERDLLQYMKKKEIATKSEAIRQALREVGAHGTDSDYDFRSWLGNGIESSVAREAPVS